MPSLSVVMIVKDEAARLAECLDSVRGIADEIVVADTGSTDTTINVARRFNATVLEFPWRDDFAEARNQALAAATGDWILHVDADEVVGPEAATRIRELLDADGSGADAIEVTLANYSDDHRAWRWVAVDPGDPAARGHAGYIAVGLLRLFRNRRGFEYREAVHESITESVRERGGMIRAAPILIHHYGYSPRSAESRDKAVRYAGIARAKVQQRPQDPKAWHDLAEQSLVLGDEKAAEQACRKALELEPLHLAAASTLANLLLNRGDLDEARALLERLEQAGIAPPHVPTALGAIAWKQGRLDEAQRRLDAALEIQPKNLPALEYLARTLDRLGDADKAHESLKNAAAVAPTIQELADRVQAHALRLEGEARFQDGEAREVLAVFVESLRLDPDDPLTHNDLGVVLAALNQLEKAKESFQRALRIAPGLPEALDNLDAMS